MKVGFVALEAQERLVLLQQVVGDRTVRGVTRSAVLRNRLVLEDKRPLLGGVAIHTQIVLAL
jgi:hypothetical protein